MNAIARALSTVHPTAILMVRMAPPVFAADYIIHAVEAYNLGAVGQARILAGRAMDAAARRPFRHHAAKWSAALAEIVALTGATPSPSVVVIHA